MANVHTPTLVTGPDETVARPAGGIRPLPGTHRGHRCAQSEHPTEAVVSPISPEHKVAARETA